MDFVKIIDNQTIGFAPRNLVLATKTILNFRYNEDLMREYGYKPLERVYEPDYSKPFHLEYIEHEEYIEEVVIYDPLVADDPAIDNSGNTFSDSEISEQGGDINGKD